MISIVTYNDFSLRWCRLLKERRHSFLPDLSSLFVDCFVALSFAEAIL